MVQNKTLIFKKAPAGFPVVGEHLAVEDRGFDLEAAPPSGGLTLSVLWASYDPYLRGKMREGGKSYTPPFELNGPFINDCVARVLKSDTPDYQPGDLVIAYLPFAEYATLKKDELSNIRRKVPKDNFIVQKGLDLGLLLGPLGMPGLTAWSSLYEIGQPKKGETIFISSAAGAVGQVVGQVSKREGLRVIGSVGTDAKLDFITKDLGFDGGFNYKKESPADALKRLCPDGIDIYYENVGGEHLEAAIDNMNTFGRIVACGMISQYNAKPEERYGVRNLFMIIGKQLTMRGFLVGNPDFGPKHAKEHQEKLGGWLADGSIKAKLSITDGIDKAAEGFVGMLRGDNFGKAVLKIKNE